VSRIKPHPEKGKLRDAPSFDVKLDIEEVVQTKARP
jgi:hypothetical protein